ncbi:MAG: hypothetical protein EBZ48_09230 [Proteobacteria bacterium]|nr:hypothetical protein [Pseudomonadota bacterium]
MLKLIGAAGLYGYCSKIAIIRIIPHMRGKGTLLLLVGAIITTLISVFGGDNLSKLHALKGSLAQQRERNEELGGYVASLRREVHGLRSDDRVLEKAARNELGMARQDEIVILFEEGKETELSRAGAVAR